MQLLSKRDQFFVRSSILLSLLLSLLDILGLVTIASLVSIITWGIQGADEEGRVASIIDSLGLSELSPQNVAFIFGVAGALFLLSKTLLSFYLQFRLLRFLSSREAAISSDLSRRILSQDLEGVKKHSVYEYQNAITLGSSAVTMGLISQVTQLISELFLQAALIITLFFYSPLIASFTTLYFGTVSILLIKVLGKKARVVGESLALANIETSKLLINSLRNFRFVFTANSQWRVADSIRESRDKVAQLAVTQSMITMWSKYALELALLFAVLGYSAYTFLTLPAVEAASLIAVFLVAVYRVAPSLMKVQTAVVQIRGSIGSAEVFFRIRGYLDEIKLINTSEEENASSLKHELATPPEINSGTFVEFRGVSYKYPGARKYALDNVSITIREGQTLGLVGKSGSGKSTFVDLLLGLLKPHKGSIAVRGLPYHAYSTYPIKVGYVPQEVFLSEEKLIDNLIRREDLDRDTLNSVRSILDRLSLGDWIEDLPEGLNTRVGELGANLSGGQRQRLGIARALLSNPELLILDEATSSLDAESENAVTNFLRTLEGRVTTIVIAHRLSTIKNLDLIYLSKGKIIKMGSFADLQKSIPGFAKQVELLGLQK